MICRVYVRPGFAKGHWVRKYPRLRFCGLHTGPGVRGWSLQLHLASGIRYIDFLFDSRKAGCK